MKQNALPDGARPAIDERRTLNLRSVFYANPEAIAAAWEALYRSNPDQSFCQSPSYAGLAAEFAVKAGLEVKILTVFEGEDLVTVWPLCIQRQAVVTILKPLSCGSDEEYSRPLVQHPERQDVFAEIFRAIISLRADVIKIYNLVQGSPFDVMLEQSLGQSGSSLPAYHVTLRQHATWQDFIATKSTSHWATLRRKCRKLQAEGDTEIGWCHTVEDADAVLAWLFTIKQEWASERGLVTPWLTNGVALEFFRQLARKVDLSTYPLISFVKCDGVPIAAQVNLISDTLFEFFITGYDPAYGHCSPGELLIEWSVKWAFDNDKDFDFRILESAYKKRWSDKVIHNVSRDIRLTLAGKAYSNGAHLLRRGRRIYSRGSQMAGAFLSKIIPGVRRRIVNQIAAMTDRSLDRKNGIITYVPRLKSPPDPTAVIGPYDPLSYDALRIIEAHLRPQPSDVIYDIGSGMGRISCYFAQRDIAKSIGIEIDEGLAKIAEANVKTLRYRKAQLELVVCDATQHDYSDGTIIIIYNPFNVDVMANFLKQLERSLVAKPRYLRVVSANPITRKAFDACGWLTLNETFRAPYGGHSMAVEIWSNDPKLESAGH